MERGGGLAYKQKPFIIRNRLANDQDAYKWKGKAEGGI